jgi:hypothetical protein
MTPLLCDIIVVSCSKSAGHCVGLFFILAQETLRDFIEKIEYVFILGVVSWAFYHLLSSQMTPARPLALFSNARYQ